MFQQRRERDGNRLILMAVADEDPGDQRDVIGDRFVELLSQPVAVVLPIQSEAVYMAKLSITPRSIWRSGPGQPRDALPK